MKNILPLFALMLAVACSSKPKNNSVSFIETSGEVNAKLKDIPPETAQYEFEG